MLVSIVMEVEDGERGEDAPRLSAAMTTPSLYLRATTDVPVTMGCWVLCLGPFCCMKEAS